MRSLARILRLLAPQKLKLAAALACMLVATGGYLSIPAAAKGILAAAMASGRLPLTPASAAIFIGAALLLTGCTYVSFLLTFDASRTLVARLRSEYVDLLLHSPMQFHRDGHAGELIERLMTATADIELFTRFGIWNLLASAIIATGAAVMMFALSWQLALTVLVAAPLTGIVLQILYTGIRRAHEKSSAASGRLVRHLHSLLSGVETVKAFGMESAELARFEEGQAGLLLAQRRGARLVALVEPLVTCVSVMIFLFLLLYGGNLLAVGKMKPEVLMAFLMYLLMLIPQARSASFQLARWQQLGVALDRIEEVLASPREADPPGATPLPQPVRGGIEFRNVHYRYSDREELMTGVSFRIEPGECVGVVGESGAGKSTLFSLLLRFYRPQSGQIMIDGFDIQQTTAASLRAAAACVPQDVVLFDGTILDNVRYGRPGASDEDVRQACRASQTESFIESLPLGYATIVGERGLKLSGGQRQRIAIARALLRNAPILLLDEVTAAIDAQTEHQLRLSMDAATEGRTTLIIAHRLATVAHLPRIMVMHSGVMVDDGPHATLLERCAIYRVFVETQLAGMGRHDQPPSPPALA